MNGGELGLERGMKRTADESPEFLPDYAVLGSSCDCLVGYIHEGGGGPCGASPKRGGGEGCQRYFEFGAEDE